MYDKNYIKGHVTIKDQNNNIIVDEDNMILKAGRKEIMDNGIGNFNTMYFGQNTNYATEDDDFQSLNVNNSNYLYVTTTSSDPLTITENNSSLTVVYSANISRGENDNMFPLATIGIGGGHNYSSTPLYTRTVFVPRYLLAGNTYSVEYKLYF